MARDYISEYQGHCLTCSRYDIFSKCDATSRGYRCIHHQRPMAMDESCSNYSIDYARSNYLIEEAVQWLGKRGYDPRRDNESCYITTIACKILGLPDDCEYLTEFRKIREYMKHSESGLALLHAYDVYGVQISEALNALYDDPKTREYARAIITQIIVPHYFKNILGYIKYGHYNEAIRQYVWMSERLGNIVGVKFQIPDVDVNTLDPETVGHGRRRVKKGE